MKATIKTNENSEILTFDGSESDLWQQIGKKLLILEVPNHITVFCDGKSAELDVQKRGTFIKDGQKHPSMYVTCDFNNILLKKSKYPEAYLKCVNLEGNNYKFYHLLPQNSGDVTVNVDAEYGSIDTDTCAPRRLKEPYDSFLYWIRYYEKLSKGYVDHTKLQLQSKVIKGVSKVEDKTVNGVLYRELMAYANHVVKESLQDSENITLAQVKEARREFNKLCSVKTYRGFKTHLQKLIALSPRNIGNRALGRNHMISLLPEEFSYEKDKAKRSVLEKEEMERIINREETLLLSMEAVVGMPNVKSDASKLNSFKQYDIDVFIATDEQKKEVMSYLTPRLQAKVDTIYRVKPRAQEKKMSEYCKKNHIKAIKKFWHGSTNANWASIIQNSLQMKPAANGRMFGDGHYFAPSADKSFNYTSFRGTTWAHGSSDVGFMGLYAVAYGNPWMVTSWGGKYNETMVKRNGYDCVHATARNTGLRADEVIIYSDSAICLNYIVKFK